MAAPPRESALPLRLGASGEAVRDVQRRLIALGYEVPAHEVGEYGPGTEAVVRQFQVSRGLHGDGICGSQTWSSLVEAGYRLGDRFLYVRSPMLRGDDVLDLQRQLGALGFDAGRVDGIFGPRTSRALVDFQRNAGLTTDAICGIDTVDALRRLGQRSGKGTTVAKVREQQTLLDAPKNLLGRRIAVGEAGGLPALADRLGRVLLDAGAVVAILHHPDGSAQAAGANEFEAELFLGIGTVTDEGCVASYFGVEGFESVGGRRLAELVLAELPADIAGADRRVRGMRLPVLRETRMPAVVCEIGPPSVLVEHAAQVVAALGRAITAWAAAPLSG